MPLRLYLRDYMAQASRWLPPIRGKGRLGMFLQRQLTDFRKDDECLREITLRNGSRLRVDIRSHTERMAYWTGDYDQKVISRLLACLPERTSVLDVGANIGFWAVPLGRTLKTLHGSLYCVEPISANYARLVENLALNQLQGVAQAFEIALGETAGTVNFSRDESDFALTGDASLVVGNGPGNVTDSVRMERLDDFARTQGIARCDFIKVDIEGGEYGFLRGGPDFLSKHRPLIYSELNPFFMKHFNWTFQDLLTLLSPLNYAIYCENKGKFSPFTEITQDVQNVLLVPRETPMEATVEKNLLRQR